MFCAAAVMRCCSLAQVHGHSVTALRYCAGTVLLFTSSSTQAQCYSVALLCWYSAAVMRCCSLAQVHRHSVTALPIVLVQCCGDVM